MAPTNSQLAKAHAKTTLTRWAFGEWVRQAETMPSDSEDEELANMPRPVEVPIEDPVEDPVPEAEEKAEKPEKVYVPKRMTEAPEETSVVCDWADPDQCFCRAWTPAHTMTSGGVTDRKITCGGRCKKGTKNGASLYDLCVSLGDNLRTMAYGDYEEEEEIAEKCLASAEFYENYPEWFNEKMTAKYGKCPESDPGDWCHYVKCCGQHFKALTNTGRTMGFPKAWSNPNAVKGETHQPIILGYCQDRCEGKEHIVFNEMGFVWENPSTMLYSNLKGGSTSADMKCQGDGKWADIEDQEGYDLIYHCWWEKCPDASEGMPGSRKCWRIKNVSDRTDTPAILKDKWQEEGWDYLGMCVRK